MQADRFRLNLLHLVSHEANVGLFGVVAFILEAIDRQAVVRLADPLDVFLQTAVREERRRLRRGRGRSRQRASAHGDVRKELSHLERVALFLHELVDQRGLPGLFGLLLQCTSVDLCLGTLKACLLRRDAKIGQLATALQIARQIGLRGPQRDALLLLRRL